MNKDLKTELKGIESTFKIAVNQKPKKHQSTGKTRKQEIELIDQMVTNLQQKLIGYTCLQMAVNESKDQEKIANRAAILMDEILADIVTNGF